MDQDGRGKAFLCAGFVLPDTSMLGFSLAWVLNERWKVFVGEQREGFVPLCSDFVTEVLSPFSKLAELEAKMELWIENGVQGAWFIDLDREVVVIYHPEMCPRYCVSRVRRGELDQSRGLSW